MMQTDTGRFYDPEEMRKIREMFADQPDKLEKFKPMDLPPTPKQMARRPPRVGRNEPCPCGSGKKFKRCCYTGPAMPSRRN